MKYTINQNNFKVRKEENGTFSFLNKTTQKIVFMNKLASFIYNNVEITDLEKLVDVIYEKFEGADKTEIKVDCERILYQMEALDIVSITSDNQKIMQGIRVAGEKDFNAISCFIKSNLHEKGKAILCNSNKKDDYSTYAIRVRQFNNSEYNFISTDEKGEINALVTLGIGLSNTVFTMTNLFADKNDIVLIKNIISYVFNVTENLTKIRITIKDDDKSKELKDFILTLGFEKEAVLKKEYGDLDLICYSVFK